jgi:hypothetical protein
VPDRGTVPLVGEGLVEEEDGHRGRKVFFLYPHSVFNEDLLVDLLSNEYEIYCLSDHVAATKVAATFPGSIFFVNIDAELREPQWEAWIRRLLATQAAAPPQIGILTYNPDPDLARKYLMDVGIPSGFIQLKLGLAEGKAIILKTLFANEAKGRRKYVRARCPDSRKASFNVTIRGTHVTGDILDISVVGMCFRCDPAVRLKQNEQLEDVQLRLRGTLCRVSGTYVGAQGSADRNLLMFRVPQPDDVRAKIHRFIYLSLQDEMAETVRDLQA